VVKLRDANADPESRAAGPAKSDDDWTPLLVRVRDQRDRAAFMALFKHFAPLVKSFALSQPGLASNALAEELVQDVLLKVWNRAETFDESRASATTWIYTLARNGRIDLLRRKHRHQADGDVDDLWDLTAEPDEEPDAQMAVARVRETVRESLKILPLEQRQVIDKIYMEGKSHSEVAAELQLPIGTVKSRVRLAMSKLKVVLER
jgi:RNA polymerase sigma-70 factor (ECF subfamily)